MPGLNGLELLKKVMPRHPIPTVMISSISMEEGPMVLNALEAGAVDYIQKPSFEDLKTVAPLIIEKVKTARLAKVRLSTAPSPATTPRRVRPTAIPSGKVDLVDRLIVIGSSTGGTEALRDVLTRLPEEIPPILIVQHIPPVFSKAFADRMNGLCPFEVKEAEHGDVVLRNRVLIAPGGTQMGIRKSGEGFLVTIDPAAGPVNRHKPSVDYLFDQVAKLAAPRTLGVILTGMGADGAQGLLNLRNAGSPTLGQDEATCVVYGMPQAAFKIGAVEKQVPLLRMADEIMTAIRSIKKHAA